MTLTRTPPWRSPGIDTFNPDQLLRTARLFASDPALPSLVDPDDRQSWVVRLDSNPYLQVWLISWPAGTHNGWHDHGESAGAFQVLSGTLVEQTSQGHRRKVGTYTAGEGRSFEHNHIHHLANVRAHPALSVHVYAPRLTTRTRYAITPTGLQLQQ